MKWRKKLSQIGEIQERVVFAWFPIECDDGFVYWLRLIRIKEQWYSNAPIPLIGFPYWKRISTMPYLND